MPSSRAFIPTSEWKDARHRRGLWGERVAMAFLTSCGWRVEAHRFRLGRHDLDIVARRGSLVAFVEVKTRGSAGWGSPAESIRWRKRRILGRVAEVWRERHGRPGDDFRFDVIEVEVMRSAGYRIAHLEDAWRLEGR